MKICTLLGCVTFKIGVSRVNYGGDIVSLHGMTMKVTFMSGRTEEEVRAKHNLAPVVVLRQDDDVMDNSWS